MNEYVAKITLDLNCQATPVVISAGQYDIGRKILITLTADGEAYDATGATAVCKGKSGSNYFAVNATVAKNIVTITTDKAMLASAGRTVAKIVLTDGTRTYSTQPFVINTHSDYDGDITTSDYYPELLDILSRVIALTESGAVLTDTALDAKSVNPVQNKVLTAIINNLVPNEEGFINTFNLADGAVTTAIIEDGAVTLDKLAADLAKIINNKADRATTLDGYGITDAYTQSQIKAKLDQKLKKMPFDSEPKQESPCYLTSGTVYNALLAKANKASTLAGYGITDAYTKNAVDASLANKADKATTLDGYGITDTYTRSEIKIRLEEKLKKMPFDSEPTLNSPCYLTSGAVYNALLVKADKTALATKYDSSNVEVGKGELTPAQAIYDGYEGSFNYSKIGKTVTVALNITTLVAGKNYVQFAGLPFNAMTASGLSSIAVYTTANKLVNIRLDGSWLYISSPGTTFAEGEKINSIITYIIN